MLTNAAAVRLGLCHASAPACRAAVIPSCTFIGSDQLTDIENLDYRSDLMEADRLR
jgi:hypothetical protein